MENFFFILIVLTVILKNVETIDNDREELSCFLKS